MKSRSQNPKKSTDQGRRDDRESSDNSSLRKAFLDQLADVYNAEQQLTKALPKMAKAAQSEELQSAFESHLEETEQQAQRLEEAAQSIGESLKGKKCKAMEGLIKEGEEMMSEFKGEAALDAVLIAAAQKVEHYEIATYGTLIEWAKQTQNEDIIELLESSLEEEKAADEKLTEIAESLANPQGLED